MHHLVHSDLGLGSVRSIEVCRFCTCPALLGLRISRTEKPTCSRVFENRKLFGVQGSLTEKQIVEILVELLDECNELIFHCRVMLQVHALIFTNA